MKLFQYNYYTALAGLVLTVNKQHTIPVCTRYSMRRVFNIQAQARGQVACILHKTQRFLMLYRISHATCTFTHHDDPLPTV